ncbi:MAG: NADH dehydrogenase [Planctomycetes bacterium GWF2_50_10]|nr:MAG: NADH dehydrogenase [Planctomycetes bacterium GWF2_50_10]
MTGTVENTYAALKEKARQQYNLRHEATKTRIQIGSATCENAAGSEKVLEEFRKHIVASGKEDVVLHRTGCTGRCSREPIVTVIAPGKIPVKYERVDSGRVHEIFTSHIMGGKAKAELMLDSTEQPAQYELFFCNSARCINPAKVDLVGLFYDKLEQNNISAENARISKTSCMGLCEAGREGEAINVLIRPGKVIYNVKKATDIDEIIAAHIIGGKTVERLIVGGNPLGARFFELYGDSAFFNRQSRLALRNSGLIDPENIYEYVMVDGFEALAKVLAKSDRGWVIDEVTKSTLRGRGGGGYPTGTKWSMAAKENNETKYIICNADEGDPGAFMDRSMLEGDPLSIIEGMMIGAYAMGASNGFFYVRAEYPLAIKRIETALKLCREHGLLGKNILGSGWDFEIEVRLGAGAFVCGEETALIHSIEGERGQPRVRPPYPTTSGLWGKPTVINNVETFANVPLILLYGAQWFKQIGSARAGGTKVFSLTGKVHHTGLVEVPMGSTLREVVFDIGGGVPGGKALKAIQTGGPAGGTIPASLIDTAVDYESLTALGSIMGSGGMIVMDETDCMVDIAKFFITFSQDESCGKCTPCREGTKRMLEILDRITAGKGEKEDLDKLERLANLLRKSSLCGLGRAAPNPVLSTMKYFRKEYDAHVIDKVCPSGKCKALVKFEISEEKCVGCTACARHCPVACISGTPKHLHVIDQTRCIRCGKCFEVCRFNAVLKNGKAKA